MSSEPLSLAELESFDPRAPSGGRERRFLCPFCGADKPRDAAHRALAVNANTGAWVCHRCGAKGLLKEFWSNRNNVYDYRGYRERKQAAIKANFAVTPKSEPKPEPATAEKIEKIRARYEECAAAFAGSPAAAYLAGRGIPEELAQAAGCAYAAEWEHWELKGTAWVSKGKDRRVVFPVRDRKGELVAVSSRAIDTEHIEPKALTLGQKSLGVFATAGALEAGMPVITEAPIDALTLALAGYPAIATIGTSWPEWLAHHCGFRTLATATDADDAGDKAAEKLTAELARMGARAIRLRPSGGKDWNDVLQAGGTQAVRIQASAALGIDEPKPEPEPEIDFAALPDPYVEPGREGDIWIGDGPVEYCQACGYRLLWMHSRARGICLGCYEAEHGRIASGFAGTARGVRQREP